MRWILIGIILGVWGTVWASVRGDAPVVLQVPWDCPQSFKTSVPIESTINIQIDSRGQWHAPAGLNSILKQAQNNSHYDFGPCLNNFIWALNSRVRKSTAWRQASPEFKNTFAAHKNKVESRVLGVIEASSKGQPVQLPGLTWGRPLTDKEKENVRRYFDPPVDGPRLSAEALDTIWPEVLENEIVNDPARLELVATDLQHRVQMLRLESLKLDAAGRARYQKAIDKLHSVLDSLPGRYGESSLSVDRLLCSDVWQPSLDHILKITQQLNGQPTCVQLKPGEAEVVRQSRTDRPWYKYQLRRLPDNKGQTVYEAELGIRFYIDDAEASADAAEASADAASDTNKQRIIIDIQNKTQACLAKYNKHLKTSQGDRVQIRVHYSRPLGGSELPFRDVSIEPAATRSHATAWARDASCATIVHELLHHFGLHDEYRNFDYYCRPVGPKRSVMSHHRLAFEAVDCSQNPDCQGVKQNWLLHPVHFNFITQPGCAVNDTYNQCMAQSYASVYSLTKEECIKDVNPACQNMWRLTP